LPRLLEVLKLSEQELRYWKQIVWILDTRFSDREEAVFAKTNPGETTENRRREWRQKLPDEEKLRLCQ
jgi:hypothetical protein